ncbi:MAG: hypothetical protein WC459_01540 [Patescibacteria group bacterium]
MEPFKERGLPADLLAVEVGNGIGVGLGEIFAELIELIFVVNAPVDVKRLHCVSELAFARSVRMKLSSAQTALQYLLRHFTCPFLVCFFGAFIAVYSWFPASSRCVQLFPSSPWFGCYEAEITLGAQGAEELLEDPGQHICLLVFSEIRDTMSRASVKTRHEWSGMVGEAVPSGATPSA